MGAEPIVANVVDVFEEEDMAEEEVFEYPEYEEEVDPFAYIRDIEQLLQENNDRLAVLMYRRENNVIGLEREINDIVANNAIYRAEIERVREAIQQMFDDVNQQLLAEMHAVEGGEH